MRKLSEDLLRRFISESISGNDCNLIVEGNPFYGILMDPDLTSKELATPAGAKKVSSIIDSLRSSGLLQKINTFSKKYNVPREFLLGVIVDEQLRAYGKSQIQTSDIWDDILAYFNPSTTSVGIAQIEPMVFFNLIKQKWSPAGIPKDLKDEILSDSSNRGSTATHSKISKELRANSSLSVETVAKLLSDYRNSWKRVKGQEKWAKSYDAWETYAYMFSSGMSSNVLKGMKSPEEREAMGRNKAPSGGQRGAGIGTIARDYGKEFDSS